MTQVEENIKLELAKLIIGYHENAHSLHYDSIRQIFSVGGLGSQVDHKMAADALVALGAKNCSVGGGKVIVTENSGAVELAVTLKGLGIRFQGSDDLPSRSVSR